MYQFSLSLFYFTETCSTVHCIPSKYCYWLGMLSQFRLYTTASNLAPRFFFYSSSERERDGRERQEREHWELGRTARRKIFYFSFFLIDAPKKHCDWPESPALLSGPFGIGHFLHAFFRAVFYVNSDWFLTQFRIVVIVRQKSLKSFL